MTNKKFVEDNTKLLIEAEKNLRKFGVIDDLLHSDDLNPVGIDHLQKRGAIFLNKFFETLEKIIEGMKPNNAVQIGGLNVDKNGHCTGLTNMDIANELNN